MKANCLSVVFPVAGLLVFSGLLQAEKNSGSRTRSRDGRQAADGKGAPQDAKRSSARSLKRPYRKWLNEDVAYIITDEERQAFKRLQTGRRAAAVHRAVLAAPRSDARHRGERISRKSTTAASRTPTSGTPPAFRAGRRTAAASTSRSGRPTKSSRILPAAAIERPIEEGGGTTSTFPFENWRYRWIEGIGNDIMIEFVDPTMTGEYRMTMDPSEKDALLYVPGAGLTMMEQMGLSQLRRTASPARTVRTWAPAISRYADAHEPVRAPGAVRELAEASGGQVQGPRGGCIVDDQVQPAADEGPRGFHPRDELRAS